MPRTFIIDTVKHSEKNIKICGWVNSRRDHGQIVFLDVRDHTGILQVVCLKDMAKEIKEEYVLQIEGKIKNRPEKMINSEMINGKIELEAEKIEILSQAAPLVFDLRKLNLSLPKLLDFRPLTLRNEKIRTIFKIQEQIIDSFRKKLKSLNFFEFESPIIVPANAEGGAEVFRVDYYNYNAYLAQSPQLYKQIVAGAFERVFTLTHVFRAEPSVTTRHLSEYISFDVEIGFIESWEEIMDLCENLIRNSFDDLEKYKQELAFFNADLPQISQKIPRLKMREAQEIIFKRTGKDGRKESDLSPEDEKEICKFSKEKYGSDLIFITHYPVSKRPFYTYSDPEEPKYTLSFDLLCRGLEIVTGGQRIHQYKDLVKNIKKFNLNPKNFQFYLQTFKYGMPPEGGFALGIERVVKQILGLENLREASLFPRDMERIDQRLSTLQTKKIKIKK